MHCQACHYPKMSIEFDNEVFCRRCLKRHVKNDQGEWELREKNVILRKKDEDQKKAE